MAEFDRGVISKEQEVIVKHTLYTDGTTNTVSMGELVRCKDCRFSDWYTAVNGKHYCYCMEHGSYGREENDFCSYGEKDGDRT